MARKKYESPKMRMSSFHCDDVLTSSGDGVTNTEIDGEKFTIGSFNGKWVD